MRLFLDRASLVLAFVALVAVMVKLVVASSAADAAREVTERQRRLVAAQTLAQVGDCQEFRVWLGG